MKHTPGPWEVQDDEFMTSVVIEDGEICDIVQDDRPEKENLANARLIAAAPELVEACRVALIYLNALMQDLSGDGWEEKHLRTKLWAAIAKAGAE